MQKQQGATWEFQLDNANAAGWDLIRILEDSNFFSGLRLPGRHGAILLESLALT